MPEYFDTLDPTHLGATASATVLDADRNPNHVLELGKPWSIEVKWETHNIPAVPPSNVADVLGGEWLVSAYLESMGAAFEGQVGPTVTVPYEPWPGAAGWTATIHVPATQPPSAAVYKLATVIAYRYGGSPKPMAGFVEGPLIQFYQAA